ncbi:MAG: succinylglutamate desuccinylase/aspartoacylase family protein [Pseudomonadota bacterium]
MKTTVEHDIDFNKPGDSRWDVTFRWEKDDGSKGSFILPVFVYNHGDGPSVMLSGGVHGDEYEGPSALLDMIAGDAFKDVAGRLIVAPVMNPPALTNNSRRSPIDDQDMNRSFPGGLNGSPTDAIAHFASTVLIPEIDFLFDLHAGGHIDLVPPSIMTLAIEDKDLVQRSIEAIDASGLPVIMLPDVLGQEGMFDAEAMRQGKVFGCAELGGGGELTAESFKITQTAVRNLLRYTGSLSGEQESILWRGSTTQRYVRQDADELFVETPIAGLFIPERSIGDTVHKGDVVGRIVSTEDSNPKTHTVKASTDGYIYFLSAGGHVEEGREVVALARDIGRDALLAYHETELKPSNRRSFADVD